MLIVFATGNHAALNSTLLARKQTPLAPRGYKTRGFVVLGAAWHSTKTKTTMKKSLGPPPVPPPRPAPTDGIPQRPLLLQSTDLDGNHVFFRSNQSQSCSFHPRASRHQIFPALVIHWVCETKNISTSGPSLNRNDNSSFPWTQTNQPARGLPK